MVIGTTTCTPLSATASPVAGAINPGTGKLYVANSTDSSVSIINTTNDADTLITTLAVGGGPSALAVDSQANQIFVANSTGNSVSVISGTSNTVAHTASPVASPFAIVANPNNNTVYVLGSATGATPNLFSFNGTTGPFSGPGPTGQRVNGQPTRSTRWISNPINNKLYVTSQTGGASAFLNVFQSDARRRHASIDGRVKQPDQWRHRDQQRGQ